MRTPQRISLDIKTRVNQLLKESQTIKTECQCCRNCMCSSVRPRDIFYGLLRKDELLKELRVEFKKSMGTILADFIVGQELKVEVQSGYGTDNWVTIRTVNPVPKKIVNTFSTNQPHIQRLLKDFAFLEKPMYDVRLGRGKEDNTDGIIFLGSPVKGEVHYYNYRYTPTKKIHDPGVCMNPGNAHSATKFLKFMGNPVVESKSKSSRKLLNYYKRQARLIDALLKGDV